ncbi:MAG: tRNA (adenosine(37)-N6)-dimethylallyltransferase MiaA [Caldilineaceae bacterium]|nr:tRNA (adenosine(37)-N6)-dimethylallyltransferase MiaA [Caldilineaceae bacterium]
MNRQDNLPGAPRLPLIVLLGPTAVGKTELSLQLAERFNGEIVGADSRQLYQGMDIGTAKPTPDELARVPHHLIDLCPPDRSITLAEYQRLAYAAIDAIHTRGRVPFLVGGTALYLRAVVAGLRIPEAPPDPALRAELEAVLANQGREELFRRLAAVDPATAAVIDRNNPRRLLRALEIVLLTGRSKVELEGADPPPYAILQIGLERPRPALYARIDSRVVAMVQAGWVGETARLSAAGYAPTLPAMTSLGYREIAAYLLGEMDLEAAIARIQIETHRFVRHQSTWFRHMPGITWFDLETPGVEVAIFGAAADFLSSLEPSSGAGRCD